MDEMEEVAQSLKKLRCLQGVWGWFLSFAYPWLLKKLLEVADDFKPLVSSIYSFVKLVTGPVRNGPFLISSFRLRLASSIPGIFSIKLFS